MPEPDSCTICGGTYWTDAEQGGQCINCGHTHPNMIDPDRLDVYGAKEAAAALGVSKARFHELRARPDFPKGTRLANGVVYRGEDIRAYAAQRKAGQS